MAGRTIQDILDEMTPEQKDLQALIVGAAVADEELDDPAVAAQYEALPDEQKYLIHFIIGGALDQESSVAHDNVDTVDAFLAHYGVKGMKWGFRKTDNGSSTRKTNAPLRGAGTAANLSGSTMNTKENRAEARKRVRNGTATAEEAHVAALKSNGHRVANAFLGDKAYWKGIAATVGVGVGVVAAGYGLPTVLPADTLRGLGDVAFFASGVPFKPAPEAAEAAGAVAITGAAYTAAMVGTQISSTVLGIKNIVRAVTGNSKVDQSYAALGDKAIANQKKGVQRTAKVLRKHGGLSGRKSKAAIQHDYFVHDEEQAQAYLEHFGVKGMKWGQRKARTSSGSAPKRPASKSTIENRAAMKTVGKEVAKAAIKYGLPAAAVAVGAGVPLAATLGVSVKVLDDPNVKAALAPVGSAAKDLTKAFGDLKMPDLPQVGNPFGTKSTTNTSTVKTIYDKDKKLLLQNPNSSVPAISTISKS